MVRFGGVESGARAGWDWAGRAGVRMVGLARVGQGRVRCIMWQSSDFIQFG